VRHTYTNVLYAQILISWDDWLCLDNDGRMNMVQAFFKKPGGASGVKKGGMMLEDKDFQKECPTLYAYVAAPTWPDGSARELSTVIVFVEDGRIKGCLSDKDTGMTLWASSGTLAGLWEALEARLTGDEVDWRPARKPKKA
jgi:hypothetical protein